MKVSICGALEEQIARVRRSAACSEVEVWSDFVEFQQVVGPGTTRTAILGYEAFGSNIREMILRLRRQCRTLPIMVLWENAASAEVAGLIRAGADCVVVTPSEEEITKALETIKSEMAALPPTLGQVEPWRRTLVGNSWPMKVVSHMIRLVASKSATVLITGETGTGKEVVARAVHSASARSQGPMVCLNCAALPQELMEAELFGHVRGAFTGAIAHRVGLIEQADQGTLFLDEIGEMPLNLQAKLLRVLQEREFQRLGSGETVKVNIRVIAATNIDLPKRVREGKFRSDLYYRLRVVPIQLPPLRQRMDDIPLLAVHFVEKVCRSENLPLKHISADALRLLTEHEWPGNVRELENAISMAVALSGESETLEIWDFPVLITPPETDLAPCILPPSGIDYERAVTLFRRSLLEQAMRTTGWNKTQAAQLLGLKRTTLTATLKSLNLNRGEEDSTEEEAISAMAS